jgi:SAM-dependent methyltransferase
MIREMKRHDFLCVDDFLRTELDARAIKSAFETGIIDFLIAGAPRPTSALAEKSQIDSVGLRLLLSLLEGNGVVLREADHISLTPQFRSALAFRDLLEARIDFADLVWPDIHSLFTPLIRDLPQFMARSRVFDLFRYDRCVNVTPENLGMTGAWVRLTTCLTKYESAALFDALDLGSAQSLIDLGGNSGEFALQACRRYRGLEATVVDLPVVCALGKNHVAATAAPAEAARIRFFPADFRKDPLPPAADVVMLKSVLHDWPDPDAEHILSRAQALVRPGGQLLIFERGPIEPVREKLTYAMMPNLVFLKFLRPPDLYLKRLAALGLAPIEHRSVDLEMAFHLIAARRPG